MDAALQVVDPRFLMLALKVAAGLVFAILFVAALAVIGPRS